MMPTFIDKSFPQKVLQIIRDYLSLHFLYDCVIHIETQRTIQNTSSNTQTDEIYAHRLVLAATSNFFREIFLVKKDQRDAVTKVNLKLYTPNAVNCFKVILGFLYSGELHLRDCDPKDILQVAKVCQITVLEDYLISESSPKVLKQPPPSPIDVKPDNKDQKDSNRPAEPIRPNPFGNDQKQAEGSLVSTFFPQVASTMAYVPVQSTTAGMPSTPTTVTLPTISAAEIRSHLFQNGYFGPILPTTGNLLSPAPHSAPPYSGPIHQNYQSVIQMALNAPRPGSATNGHRASLAAGGDGMIQLQPVPKKMTAKRANAKLMQGLSPSDAPFDNLGDVIVPSSEKEGWCRNKKYIERVQNGFMCTVCRKVYGRYNSVSYHVTIYHRNPPIQCDEPGCQFTTREARYIHFHKYYRHHIALPESIDLGSRKCPFCRHVSKSPAMLEKHINRHIPNKVGRTYQCPQCPEQLSSHKAMYDHMVTHSEDKNYPCDQCNYKGRTESNLTQHVLFKHSSVMFKQKMCCKIDDCNFTSASVEAMEEHKTRVHGKAKNETNNTDSLLDLSRVEDDAADDDITVDEEELELIDVDGESAEPVGESNPLGSVISSAKSVASNSLFVAQQATA